MSSNLARLALLLEADDGASVVVVFRRSAPGTRPVAFALTRGESSAKALGSVTYRVRVR